MADYSNQNKNLGAVFSPHAVDSDEFSRVEPLITPEQLRRRHLFGIPLYSAVIDPVTNKRDMITDEDLKDYIIRSVAQVELETGLTLFPTEFDEKYPFDRNYWESYGYMQLNNRPIASVEKLAFTPATQVDILELDPSWIESANFYKGVVNVIPLVPATGINDTQVTIGSTGGAAFITFFYGKGWIPALIRAKYTCGFPNRQFPRMINEIVGAQAAINVLSMLAATNKVSSYSINLDGGGQSVSTPGPEVYNSRIENLEKQKHILMQKIRNVYGLNFHSSYV